MLIYKITNQVTNKTYVGKTTKTLEHRLRSHCYSAGYGSKALLHRSIRKHSVDAFTIDLLEEVEETNCINERERHWIALLKPEYNMTIGGDGGDTSAHIDYSKYNWSGENNPMYGRRGADNPNFGKKRTEQQKLNSTLSSYAQERSRPVMFENVRYRSIKQACESTGRSHKFIKKHGVMLDGTS